MKLFSCTILQRDEVTLLAPGVRRRGGRWQGLTARLRSARLPLQGQSQMSLPGHSVGQGTLNSGAENLNSSGPTSSSCCCGKFVFCDGQRLRRRVMCGDCQAREAMGRPTFAIPLILFAVMLTVAQAKNVRFHFSSCWQIERCDFDPASRTGWFCTAISSALTLNHLGNSTACYFFHTRLQKLAKCSAIALYVYL